MAISEYFPGFRSAAPKVEEAKADADTLASVLKLFRPNFYAVSADKRSISSFFVKQANFEASPYDFDRISAAIDSDSYAQQAFAKYRELIWKEGWQIVGKNADAVDYLWKRIRLFEVAMNRSFYDFLVEIADQLVKYNNVFIVKSRSDLQPFFPAKLYLPEGKKPIVGYFVLPTEKVEIQRDKNNRPVRYRQKVDEAYGGDIPNNPSWPASEVIHLTRNRKPARAFGTPFVTAAIDDIMSVRQVEEDMLNLMHRELFPLYFYKVGTDMFPADKAAIESAYTQLDALRTEGGIIAPHTHELEIMGSEKNALDINFQLNHFKERVAIGLGVFPHHLGMSMDGGNRSATDRLDIALYDKVKEYQRYISEEIRRCIFNELLIEGGFDPFGLDSMEEAEDMCVFQYNEIDVDTQVKKESHTLNKLDRSVISQGETRREIGYNSDIDDEDTIEATRARIMTKYTMEQQDNAAKHALAAAQAKASASPTPAKKTPQKAATKSTAKGSGNIVRPSNQHGTRTSPSIRHSTRVDYTTEIDNDWVDTVESLLDE